MESESQSSVENDDANDKREHIKQRLKDMGVSVDSKRPEKSFLSKYGKYFMLVVFCALLAAYWLEYNKQDETENVQVAEDNTVSAPVQQTSPYAHPQYNQMAATGYRSASPAPWMRPPVVPQNNTGEQSASDNGLSKDSMQQNQYPYYARRYPAYPRPYWQNYSGYYPPAPAYMYGPMPGYGYRQAPNAYPENTQTPARPAYPVPYSGQPYYNGWQRY